MTEIRKLKNHPYAQCKVFETVITDPDCGHISMRRWVLRSYETDVVLVRETDTEWQLTCYGTYSQTTRKHIGWFLRDIGSPFTYYSAKRSFENASDIVIVK